MALVAQQVTLDIYFKLNSIRSVVLTYICFSSIFILLPGEGETHEPSHLSHCFQVNDAHWLSQDEEKGWGQAGMPAPSRSP